ncbi:TIGR02530 family flagellar biosynthesis protein [Paenibacillus sp.]|uniref:TIGR02530 family flagellar biosynthesis protein n=1 Tax=Paenibacillus sp. TaxID=58172 RepID=UPI002D2D36A6|nr:TIGR02530 family flagellar biosynthesis protein [Paenibacillus sp.]HZG84395.1 TIGR02530 family flagellar biosynthesis protein [Paenibacillus sp.]
MNERQTINQLYPNRAGFFPPKPAAARPAAQTNGPAFRDVLDRQFLKFSHHAEQRLAQRGIRLEPEQLSRIGGAVDKAAAKGAKDSLVLFQDMAFIVNVKNRTVVTAMDGASMNDHVFTQIDSTIVVK